MRYVHRLYEYDYKTGRITPKNRRCPQCNSFMAFHKEPKPRWHCGKCGRVDYVHS